MLDHWYLENLACPRDYGELTCTNGALVCATGHRYPVVDGVPVMLLDDVPQTLNVAAGSLARAVGRSRGDERAPELYLESLGISEQEKMGVIELVRKGGPIDPVVAYLVAATNGLMYKHLIGRLDRYPIPDLPLPAGAGRLLLDVGCSWGRWCVGAHSKGYQAVGIDPSLGAVMAARRVARQLGLPNLYLVGDARYLPFRAQAFDSVFSYSVIQHLSRQDAAGAVGEMGRVVKAGGAVKVQMPTRFGLRCLYHQARRGFREAVCFEVRYWTIPQLWRLFTRSVGQTQFEVDGFFGIGLRSSDEAIMLPAYRVVLAMSESLKTASRRLPALVWLADSVFVDSVKTEGNILTAENTARQSRNRNRGIREIRGKRNTDDSDFRVFRVFCGSSRSRNCSQAAKNLADCSGLRA